MSEGLYSSIYGKVGKGIFDDRFGKEGASPPTKRMEVRLGDYGEAVPFFERDLAGIPIWLIAIGFVGFAYVRRKKKKDK